MEFLVASAPETPVGSIWSCAAGTPARRLVEAPRPSFIARAEVGGHLYAVAERSHGGITSLNSADGTWTEIGFSATETADPCFVEVHPTGDWLFAASYSSGHFTVHPIAADGVAGLPSQVVPCPKPGDVPASEVSHAHAIRTHPGTGLVMGTDLGGDRISTFTFNATTGALDLLSWLQLPEGSGPRHLAFVRDDRVVISCELTPGVVLAQVSADGDMSVIDHVDVPCEPGDASSEIAIIGDFAVMGIRGSDRLVSVRIDGDALIPTDSATSGGSWPRHFAVIDGRIVVAHQHSNSVDVVSFDAESGTFGAATRLAELPAPQCILPLP